MKVATIIGLCKGLCVYSNTQSMLCGLYVPVGAVLQQIACVPYIVALSLFMKGRESLS